MTESAHKIIQIQTSIDEEKSASKLARSLVEERLVACIQIIPGMHSLYLWKGKIESDEEFLLIMKTVSENKAIVMERIRELHSYETPEILVVAVEETDSDYAEWLVDSCDIISSS